MSRYMNVPQCIVDKQPSPDLFAGMKDEEIMGIGYADLDAVISLLADGKSDEEIEQLAGVNQKSIQYVREMRRLSGPLRAGPASLLER